MSQHFSWQAAVTKSDLASSTKLVLLVIGTYMNQHGSGAFPSYKTLASDTSMNRVTVIRHVEIAVELGWLEKRSRVRSSATSGRFEADSNTYAISFPNCTGQPPVVAQGNHPSCTGQPPVVAQGNPNTPALTPQVTQEHAPVVPSGDRSAGELHLTNGDEKALPQVSTAEIIRDAYNEILGKRKGCIACRAINAKFARRLQQVDRDARKTCADNDVVYAPVEFWEMYFNACLKDPWLRGDKPNPNNPRWRQSLKTLVDDDRFLQIANTLMDEAEVIE